jgi:hypothetical protein
MTHPLPSLTACVENPNVIAAAIEAPRDERPHDVRTHVAEESWGAMSASGACLAALNAARTAKPLFRRAKIRCTRRANIPRVEISPSQRHGEHCERDNNPGNGNSGFCWHGYASFFGNGASGGVFGCFSIVSTWPQARHWYVTNSGIAPRRGMLLTGAKPSPRQVQSSGSS